jgi:DNA-directed RNA polymerase subunit E'/Rpb7
MAYLVNIHTHGRHSGRRVIKDFKKKLKEKVKGKCIWHYRVTLMDGSVVSVKNVDVVMEIPEKK